MLLAAELPHNGIADILEPIHMVEYICIWMLHFQFYSTNHSMCVCVSVCTPHIAQMQFMRKIIETSVPSYRVESNGIHLHCFTSLHHWLSYKLQASTIGPIHLFSSLSRLHSSLFLKTIPKAKKQRERKQQPASTDSAMYNANGIYLTSVGRRRGEERENKQCYANLLSLIYPFYVNRFVMHMRSVSRCRRAIQTLEF